MFCASPNRDEFVSFLRRRDARAEKKTGRTLPDTSNIYIAQWASEVTGTVTGEVTGYPSGRGIMSDDVCGENFDNER